MKTGQNLPPKLRPRKGETLHTKGWQPRATDLPAAQSRTPYAGTSRPQK